MSAITLDTEPRPRAPRPTRARDCPFCGAVVTVRVHDDGGASLACRCCGWWRVERADGEGLEESRAYLRRRFGEGADVAAAIE